MEPEKWHKGDLLQVRGFEPQSLARIIKVEIHKDRVRVLHGRFNQGVWLKINEVKWIGRPIV